MLETSYRPQVFLGVHFVLFGFDPITENKVRFKLVNGGGVDMGQYSRSCSHVIVDKLEYDDPVCVAAQNDGKTLVTALWVDHSADIGMPVDASSVMYRPLKNLNGIPGAKSLIVCLTGYQRQDRDDIMTMVGLLGAQFSKPLVANKVTHLICYKFEGEKYELAKKLPTIRLVNHRWLEDCLKEWVLLPEDKYSKSGYELEMMEAEAKDSEEEAEGSMLGQSVGRNINRSPLGSKSSLAMARELSKSVIEASNAYPDSIASEGLVKVNKGEDLSSISGNGYRSDQVSRFNSVNNLKMSSEDPDVVRKESLVQLPETYVKAHEHSNSDIASAFGCQDHCGPADANPSGSSLLPDMHYGPSEARESVNDLRSTSESAKRAAHTDAKVSAISNSRKNTRKFTLPKNLDESLGNVTGPFGSRLDDLKFGNNLETAISEIEKAKGSISSRVKASSKGCDFINGEESISLLPQKRIAEASFTPLKSRKVTPNAKSSVDRTPPANDKVQGMKLASLINEPPVNEDHFSVSKDGVSNSTTSLISQSARFTSNSLPLNVPFSKHESSESVQGDNAHQKLAKASFKCSSMSKINGKPEITSSCMGKAAHDGNAAQPQNVQEDLGNSSPSNKRPQDEESTGLANLNLCNKVANNLVRKSPRKKTIAKKSLGARPKLNAAAKQKGSVSLERAIPKVDGVNCSSSCNHPATCDAEKLQTSLQIADAETSLEQENVNKLTEDASNRTQCLDDETEAPEDELGMAPEENKSELVTLSKKADTKTEEKSKAIIRITKCEEEMPPKKGRNQSKQQRAFSRTKPELLDLSSKAKENHKRKKCPAGRNKMKTTVAMDEGRIKIHNERKDDAEMETPEQMPLPAGRQNSSTLPTNNSDIFSEEKENIPIAGEQDIREGGSGGNSGIKSSVGSAKINQRVSKTSDNSSVPENSNRGKSEAVCFIVSGHRLQRKEFQQVIRRLKGRVCRDSHQWSYQATHFIAPDPIRRTEKFFAAAASGRWILKTDYLTASSQAGKFLAEEPYEWHKSSLSEDGAISMEAPRKWRLLKERTGHGALYGMRAIIYGDCIAPPLDTLKRVIKAGDGTLLATSPPYTRFLDKGIDYAIVSPGMPRVDVWVQEFLKHEIPCVVADYLVEYVCKPGFSLERHVLYGTQAWAERSFAKLQSMAEEITEELAPPENSDDNDIMCLVCGFRDRGEVMLICGDETGSVGCGIGTHIDCCDPPLDSVPEEDWFCPKCRTRNCSNPPKKKENRLLSSSKRK